MRKLVIGLTGGIATGKTTALRAFKKLGAHVLDLDELAHGILDFPKIRSRLMREYGGEILNRRGRVDRQRLGKIIFKNIKKRRQLEKLTHPLILRKMRIWIQKIKEAGVVVVDVPLLFEKNLKSLFDLTLLVYAGPKDQLWRIRKRNGLAPGEALRRLRAQWPMDRKAALADLVVPNTQTKARLIGQVRELYRAFQLLRA
ncbi:MAG: dephospho-CoA kinase [Elusimicrobia bacterium]|nr:dephospho-CoA kinase [Elusimicrobiota bacterium]